jgi:hypothetical protein
MVITPDERRRIYHDGKNHKVTEKAEGEHVGYGDVDRMSESTLT